MMIKRFVHANYLRRQVSAAGGKLEGGPVGRYHVYQCEAPAGKVWAASDTHALKVEWRTGDTDDRVAAITDALERVAHGLCDCGDPDCDVCQEGEQ
jgi:hypothetical protein